MPDIYVAKEIKKETKEAGTREKTRAKSSRSQSNPFASFIIQPQKVTFDTQEEGEKIIFLARRHLVTNLGWILIALLLFCLPGIILRVFPQVFDIFPNRPIIILVWYLLVFSYALEQFLKWFFNVNIITDERVVDIDFPSILYRDVSSTQIEHIQDISAKTGGFVRSFFDFGDVRIQTAGEKREFTFEAVPKPDEIVKILNQLTWEEEQEKIEGRVR